MNVIVCTYNCRINLVAVTLEMRDPAMFTSAFFTSHFSLEDSESESDVCASCLAIFITGIII